MIDDKLQDVIGAARLEFWRLRRIEKANEDTWIDFDATLAAAIRQRWCWPLGTKHVYIVGINKCMNCEQPKPPDLNPADEVGTWRDKYLASAEIVDPASSKRAQGGMKEVDNTYSNESKPPRRFFLRRLKDETGISRTGRVLEGVQMQSGRIMVEWRPPHSTIGIYKDLEEFRLIHVDCHPSCNEIVWIDEG